MANVTNILVKNINMDIPIDNEIITINTIKNFPRKCLKSNRKLFWILFQLTLHRSKNPLTD